MEYVIELHTEDNTVHQVKLEFDQEKIPLTDLIQPLHLLFDTIVRLELKQKKFSCKKGCSSCCIQMIPLSIPETFYLGKIISGFPRHQKKQVLRRFEKSKGRLIAAGLYEKLKSPSLAADLDEEYFNLRLVCPFLEAGECSIYQQRPFVCREYYVSSDPVICTHPYKTPPDKLVIPYNIGALLAAFSARIYNLSRVPIAHIIAPEWAGHFMHLEMEKYPVRWLLDQIVGALGKDRYRGRHHQKDRIRLILVGTIYIQGE